LLSQSWNAVTEIMVAQASKNIAAVVRAVCGGGVVMLGGARCVVCVCV
jgi:hypothetical protein